MTDAAEVKTESALLELAERCEAATGADRELDGELDRLLHDRPANKDYDEAENCLWQVDGVSGLCVRYDGFARKSFSAASYTASLDAAMTLVPVCPMTGGNRYAVRLDSGFYGATAELWHECSSERFHGHAGGQHEALPRALCAASLRARASLPPSTETRGEK